MTHFSNTEVGKKGMPLPKIDNVNYVNPKITLVKVNRQPVYLIHLCIQYLID